MSRRPFGRTALFFVAFPAAGVGYDRPISIGKGHTRVTQRILIVMILAGLAGCSHPRPQPVDGRSALLRPVATTGAEDPKDTSRTDHKVHGAVSVGTGLGGRGNYGVGGPQSALGSMTGTGMTGTGISEMGTTPGSW